MDKTNVSELADFFPSSSKPQITVAVIEVSEGRFSYSVRVPGVGALSGGGHRSEAAARAAGEAALARAGVAK